MRLLHQAPKRNIKNKLQEKTGFGFQVEKNNSELRPEEEEWIGKTLSFE